MPWKPGESGNPSGRPKVDYYLRNLARQHTEDAVQTLVNVMQDMGAQSSARVTAAIALLDRGWGKPAQAITGEGGGAIVVQIATGIDRDPCDQVRPGEAGGASLGAAPPSFLRDADGG